MPPAGPPYIGLTSLKIRDFRGIDHLELDFRDPGGQPNNLAVLAGPNGSGKTTVLEAALIALGGDEFTVGSRGRRAIRRGAAAYEIRAEIRGGTPVVPGDFTFLNRSDQPPRMPLELPSSYLGYFSSWRAPIFVGSVDVTVGETGPRSVKADPNRLLFVKQQLASAAAAERFREGSPPFPYSVTYSQCIASINEHWKKFYPSSIDEFRVGLADSQREGGGAFEVFFTREGSPPLPVDDLSAGQLELFLFLASLALNSERVGIIFIDEPELHLDPLWHVAFMRMLMSLQPKAQFIVATHSHAIYAAAMSYERHFLVPDDDPRAKAWPRVKTGSEAGS